MKDFRVLKFLDKFSSIFEKFGIDYKVMRKIVQIKLIMDSRRVPTVFNNRSRRKENTEGEGSVFSKPSLVYVFISLIMIPFLFIKANYDFCMSFVFGIAMFMIMTTLISDFSSVLLDLRDRNIISSKPIESKILSMAKIIHICIYIFFITMSLTGIPLVVSLFRHGFLFFIIFLIEIILMDLLVIMMTALLYLVILKFFDGEKLKDIINYVQIILTITLTIGYQLIGRMFDFTSLSAVFVPKWWEYFIIPVWFGAPFELILNGNHNIYNIVFSILAVIIPIISIILYLKLMPTFERSLQKLDNNGEDKKSKSKFTDKLANVVCFTKTEKIFFKFTSDMIKNERDFKLKVYPSLGMSIIFPFIFMMNGNRNFSNIGSGKSYINLYFCALMLPMVIMMVKYSKNYKGAWIYKVSPLKNTSDIYKGTFKSVILNLIVPIFILECIIFLFIFGLRIVPDLILIFLNMMLYTVICFKAFKRSLPFSVPYATGKQTEGLIMLPIMMLLGVLALVHFLATLVTFGVYIYILVVFIIDVIAWKFAFSVKI
jgi:ABC-2 type transport system permease protein